jgi:proteasome lid subunit RPN8/RPN11
MIISEQEEQIGSSCRVIEIMSAILNSEHETDLNREHLWAIGLNRKNIIQYVELVSLGSSHQSVVDPREVFRFAIMKGVAAIILCHNHPSGDPTPSLEDVNATKRLSDAGKILGIGVLDHIVLGKPSHGFSFYEQGSFNQGFRAALFSGGGIEWQIYRDTVSAPLRKKRYPKKNSSGEAVAADHAPRQNDQNGNLPILGTSVTLENSSALPLI